MAISKKDKTGIIILAIVLLIIIALMLWGYSEYNNQEVAPETISSALMLAFFKKE